MNQKPLVLLVAATVGAVALAAFSLRKTETAAETTTATKQRLYPDLLAKVNDVATVTIQNKDGTTTLRKGPDSWGLAEKGDYPVEMEPVRKMLIVLSEMTKLEGKTSDPARYAAIDVQDPTTEGSKSALVTLKDASGHELAQLILGKEHDSKTSVSNQRYVRKQGEAQSWLVQGTFDLKEKAGDWLQKRIVEVKRDRVRSVEITQPDGELLVVMRASPELTDFTLLEIPEGKELTYPTAPGSVAGGLEYVNLEDVEPAGKVDFSAQPGATAKFKTFDGLVVTVTTKDVDGKSYARFEASYEAPPPPPPATPPVDPANPDAAPKKPESAQKSPEEVQKEVADLNARLSKWTYVISSYARTNFGKKKAELLKDKAPPPPPPGETPADGAVDKDAYAIPDNLPKEIQEQIRADQEARGNKTVIVPAKKPAEAAPTTDAPKDVPPAAGNPAAGTPAPVPAPTPPTPPH